MGDTRLLALASTGADVDLLESLSNYGCQVTVASTLGETVRHAVTAPPDAIIAVLAASLAAEYCEVLAALGDYPLIVAGRDLSSKTSATCLDNGADAVLGLPLPPAELAFRIDAVQRRAKRETSPSSRVRTTAGEFVLNVDSHSVSWRGGEIDLTPTEYRLLSALADNPGRVVTTRELLTRAWSEEYADDVHYVRLYIGYLRRKLEENPRRPRLILTQWGVGYRLAGSDQAAIA